MDIFLKMVPMVPVLVETLGELIRCMCSKFILNDVLEKVKTTSLIKLNMLQKITTEVTFGLKS